MDSSSTLSMLPLNLIREILLRTPAESLVPSMLTCKQWNDVINDKEKSFIYEHLDRSPVRFLRVDKTVQVMDLLNRTRSDSPLPDDVDFRPVMPYTIHCDGLMLCSCPSVSFSWLNLYTPPKLALWKLTHVDRYVHWKSSNGVSVNGNMYWLALGQKRRPYILGFDFSLEKFKDICFCPSSSPLPDRDYDPFDAYLGGLNGDSLSLLEQKVGSRSPIVVWFSSKLADGNVSFVRHFSVPDSPDLPVLRPGSLAPCPVYCIAENKRIITLSNHFIHEIDENGVIRERRTKGFSSLYTTYYFCGYVYVPSLVPLP